MKVSHLAACVFDTRQSAARRSQGEPRHSRLSLSIEKKKTIFSSTSLHRRLAVIDKTGCGRAEDPREKRPKFYDWRFSANWLKIYGSVKHN